MADVNVNIKGVFESKGGAVGGRASGGAAGASAEGGGFNFNKVFTQPMYDLMRVIGVSFRNIAGIRLGAKAGSMFGGEGAAAGAQAAGAGGAEGAAAAGGGGAGAGAGAGAAAAAGPLAILVVIAMLLKKILDHSEMYRALMTTVDMTLGAILDMILMGVLFLSDYLGIAEKIVTTLQGVYDWWVGSFGELFSDLYDLFTDFSLEKLGEVFLDVLKIWLGILGGVIFGPFMVELGIALWDKIGQPLVDKFMQVYEYLTGEYWTEMKEKLIDLKDKLVTGITDAFTTVLDVTGIEAAFNAGKEVFNTISGLDMSGITSLAGLTWDGVTGLAGKTWDGLTGLAGLGYDKFTDLFSIGAEKVQSFIDLFSIDLAAKGILDFFGIDFSDAIAFVENLTNAGKRATSWFSMGDIGTGSNISNAWDAATDWI